MEPRADNPNSPVPQYDVSSETIDRHLAGECSADEGRAIAAWQRTSPEAETSVLRLKEAIAAAHATNISSLGIRERADHIIAETANDAFAGVERRRPLGWGGTSTLRSSWGRAMAMAGAAAIVALAFFATSRTRNQPSSAPTTYTTRVGEVATIALSDGSRVKLAPNSTLQLVDFGGSARTLRVTGEAYFTVVASSRAPFIVRAGTVDVRVLGTEFTVRHYNDDRATRVAVLDGKVRVSIDSAASSGVVLPAGRTATLTDSAPVSTGNDANAYAAWTKDRLVFHNTPARDVLADLGRWYGSNFKLADSSLANQKITAGLSTRSIVTAVATLENVLDVDAVVEGRVITLRPRRGSPQKHDATPPRARADRAFTHPTSEAGR